MSIHAGAIVTLWSLEVRRGEILVLHVLHDADLHGLHLRTLLCFIYLRRTLLLVHNLLVTLKRGGDVSYILF